MRKVFPVGFRWPTSRSPERTIMTSRIFAFAVSLLIMGVQDTMAMTDVPNIMMRNFDFSPASLAVPRNTTVTWKNVDGEPHTVTSTDGLFRSGALDQNDTFSFRFTTPGTYRFFCSIHPRMTGTVTVE